MTNWPSLWRSRSLYASSLVSQAQYSLISVYTGLASDDPNLTPIDHWGVLTRRPLSTPPLVHIQYIRWLRHCQSKMLRKLKVEDFPDFSDFLEYDLQICSPGLLWWHCPHSACLQTWKPCKWSELSSKLKSTLMQKFIIFIFWAIRKGKYGTWSRSYWQVNWFHPPMVDMERAWHSQGPDNWNVIDGIYCNLMFLSQRVT